MRARKLTLPIRRPIKERRRAHDHHYSAITHHLETQVTTARANIKIIAAHVRYCLYQIVFTCPEDGKLFWVTNNVSICRCTFPIFEYIWVGYSRHPQAHNNHQIRIHELGNTYQAKLTEWKISRCLNCNYSWCTDAFFPERRRGLYIIYVSRHQISAHGWK